MWVLFLYIYNCHGECMNSHVFEWHSFEVTHLSDTHVGDIGIY